MAFNFSKSIIAAGLICTSLTAIAAMAQNSGGEMSGSSVPLPPPGPFTSGNSPAVSEKTAEKPASGEKFAPLNFDPEKPAADASANTDVSKSTDEGNVGDEGKAEADMPKPAYAPAETAKIPVEKMPETKVDGLPTSVGVEAKTDAGQKAVIVEKPAGEATPEAMPQPKANAVPKPVETAKDGLPKYAPAGTAEMPNQKEPAKSPINTEAVADAPEPTGEAPSYAPADTAKIPVPVDKADPVDAKKAPEYAPAGTGTAPPPSNVAPGYGYQQPQFMPRQFIPPQFRAPQYQVPQNQAPQYQNRQYQAQRPAPGYGYAPQNYPPGYVPQQGFWPQQGYQPYPNPQMQQQPWGNQQPRQWQQPQQQPQWQQPQWQMPRQGYGYPNPNYWNPFRPPAQQGWPQQNTPRTNNQPGN